MKISLKKARSARPAPRGAYERGWRIAAVFTQEASAEKLVAALRGKKFRTLPIERNSAGLFSVRADSAGFKFGAAKAKEIKVAARAARAAQR